MTELVQGAVEVRREGGRPVAVRTPAGWRAVAETALTWIVDTDWWREPVRREYLRCLLEGGECIDLYRDLLTDEWHLSRRHD